MKSMVAGLALAVLGVTAAAAQVGIGVTIGEPHRVWHRHHHVYLYNGGYYPYFDHGTYYRYRWHGKYWRERYRCNRSWCYR
jgi:hypothetical protein